MDTRLKSSSHISIYKGEEQLNETVPRFFAISSVSFLKVDLRTKMCYKPKYSKLYFGITYVCEQSLWIIPEQFFPIFTLTAMTERKYPYD
jgi:hypothetical protein